MGKEKIKRKEERYSLPFNHLQKQKKVAPAAYWRIVKLWISVQAEVDEERQIIALNSSL